MARSQIERHPQRAEIEKAIRAGVSSRAIARQYGFKAFSTVAAYARKLKARDDERREENGKKTDIDRLVDRLNACWNLLTAHIAQHDPASNPKLDRQTLEVLKEMRAVCREIANVKGLMRGPGIQIGIGITNNNANVTGQPSADGGVPADEVKAALFRALRGHPQARDSVVAEFQRIQRRYDGAVIDVTPAPRLRTRGNDHAP